MLIFVKGDGCLAVVRIGVGVERYVALALDGSRETDCPVATKV